MKGQLIIQVRTHPMSKRSFCTNPTVCFHFLLAAALSRVMRVAVPIPALASVSVLQSAAVGGSVVGVVGPL